MTTGLHLVKDLFCNSCHQIVGWKYVLLYALYTQSIHTYLIIKIKAFEESQRYKEGRFILESVLLTSNE